jgi:hypothetical protein
VSRLAALLALATAVSGCTKDAPAPLEDRTLARLKAEQERLARGGAPGGPPKQEEDPLARAASNPQPARALAVRPSAGTLGVVEYALTAAEVSQTVRGAKVDLSTPERFLRVVLTAKASAPATVTMGEATLAHGESVSTIARDAQRVGPGSPLSPVQLTPGVAQELVLYFEVPADAVGGALKLVLTQGAARLELVVQ